MDWGHWFTGVLGSAAVEIVAALRACSEINGAVPELYKRPFYIFVRVLLALFVAGPIAMFLGDSNLGTDFYLGISAPLIIDRLAKGLSPSEAIGAVAGKGKAKGTSA